MVATDHKQDEIGEFEQASQKLLLNIALEASSHELQQIVASRRKPANLSGYYRSLQSWHSPVLHQVDA
ncbi:MAG: hypothetical protein OSB29_07430 [Verrucomicrobiota bacterium]|nr:hypothetical protein [Verrucomicrobiota bacterium]